MSFPIIVETSKIIPIKIKNNHQEIIRMDRENGNRVYKVKGTNFEAKVCFHTIIGNYIMTINNETIFIVHGMVKEDENEGLMDVSFNHEEIVCFPYATRFIITGSFKSIYQDKDQLHIVSGWNHPLSPIIKEIIHKFDPITGNSSKIDEQNITIDNAHI